MKTLTKRLFALVGVLALGLVAVRAQDSALISALVKKGVLSDQEAEDIRADIAKEDSLSSAGKLSIASQVTNLKLYGDARLRYEYIDDKPQFKVAANDSITERARYRIRIGADYTFTDNFSAGVELESNSAADSANQTLGNGYAKEPIYVGLVYLQYKPTDWATLIAGKFHNPLYTTDLVWDPDINPEGAAETFSWTLPLGDDAPVDTKDVKDFKAPIAAPSQQSLTIGFTAFQGIYADNNENGATGTDNTDVWQFVEQVPIQYNYDKSTFVKVVPGFDTYLGGGNTNLSSGAGEWAGTSAAAAPFPYGSSGSQGTYVGVGAANNLALVTVPGEVDWKAFDLPFKFYWDFALNLDGKSRIQNTYLGVTSDANTVAYKAANSGLGDNLAWLAGVQIGQNKKKGDFSGKADFRQTGLGAVDPNENDSDFANSNLNMQGFKVQGQYNFTDFLIGSVTYYDTWNYKQHLFDNSNLPGGAPAAGTNLNTIAGLASITSEQRVQVDLMWKF